MSSEKLILLM